jgi:hypothetical protein
MKMKKPRASMKRPAKAAKPRQIMGGFAAEAFKHRPPDMRDELAEPRSVREKVRRGRGS